MERDGGSGWGRGLGQYLIDGFRIDTRSLAVFRIAAGLLIVADVLLRARNFSKFYTESGVVPRSLAIDMTSDGAFSLYHASTDPWIIGALFVLTALVGIQLAIGYKTRVAVVASFLLVISLDHHNPLVLSYADILFRLFLFWAIFLPLGERWSIDALHADRPRRGSIASLASAAILLQLINMYVVNAYHKSHDELWTGGEATVLIMGLDDTTFFLGEFMRNFPTLLQLGGLSWYYLLWISPLLIVLRGRARMALAGALMAGHASFIVTVRIGAFSYVAIAGLFLFMQGSFWRDARALAERVSIDPDRLAARLDPLVDRARGLPELRVESETVSAVRRGVYAVALVAAATTFLVLGGSPLLQYAGVTDDTLGPEDRIEERAEVLSLDQPEWSVFAPHPRTTDRYHVFTAQTADGELIDVYNDRGLTYERPGKELQQQYDTYRERFYMNSVRRSGSVAAVYADHLCETWAEERGVELTHINMYAVTEDVTGGTVDDPEDRDREASKFYQHGCGGHEPTEIAPP